MRLERWMWMMMLRLRSADGRGRRWGWVVVGVLVVPLCFACGSSSGLPRRVVGGSVRECSCAARVVRLNQ